MQSGIHAGRTIVRRLRDQPDEPFKYRDLGSMATISRFRAVVSLGPLRLSGFIGWLGWLLVHLAFLTGFKNRVATIASWTVAFIGHGRPERAITAREALGPPDTDQPPPGLGTDARTPTEGAPRPERREPSVSTPCRDQSSAAVRVGAVSGETHDATARSLDPGGSRLRGHSRHAWERSPDAVETGCGGQPAISGRSRSSEAGQTREPGAQRVTRRGGTPRAGRIDVVQLPQPVGAARGLERQR
jgi:hypothetical protein